MYKTKRTRALCYLYYGCHTESAMDSNSDSTMNRLARYIIGLIFKYIHKLTCEYICSHFGISVVSDIIQNIFNDMLEHLRVYVVEPFVLDTAQYVALRIPHIPIIYSVFGLGCLLMVGLRCYIAFTVQGGELPALLLDPERRTSVAGHASYEPWADQEYSTIWAALVCPP